VFHYDRGLKLTKGDLAVDFRRRQPRGFISHAHVDHMARHELALCTPATARLYQHRLGKRPTLEMPYREPLEWGGLRLTTFPAGHCLGSAMLLAEDERQSLLYTGDFKLHESASVESAEVPQADILVIEGTFGRLSYQMPDPAEVCAELIKLVQQALDDGKTPVLHAYALGKAQEVTKILTRCGIPVLQHPEIYKISQIYVEFGVDLGECREYKTSPRPGYAVIVPPRRGKSFRLPGLEQTVTFAITGWAMDQSTRFRWGVDHAIPLSDHADFGQLVETVERVAPRQVYVTHGPPDSVDFLVHHLDQLGFSAAPLERPKQTRMF
jgi:Cft2 family RNA processing exonuclease